ncbi:caspase-8-like isoform X3 [Sinocyclocheilus anshuiensis]|uniref:caspase-8-like isoform X3 n=1 Tax=Sinocyclocheilus anshuiensis TaxID=1608454 RepID=UPI0007B98ECA|nr:PREDICTED: caspase-8-like isoform X3 [Sinocyclocheilus anshuiensis]
MAEKVLEQLRIKLKEGLTEAVIKNLLDDLRVKKVLGNEEIEEIVQKTKPRADQARDLIDGVSRKGTKASEIMLACLKDRDNCLSDNLNIDSHLAIPERGATCSPAPAPHSTTDKQSNLDEEYKMDSNPRGLCVIINNENFVDPENKRNGSQNDVDSLKAIFEFLVFLVEVKTDKTADQIKALMAKYSKDARHGDCFVCCVMSHGNKSGVEGCDEQICPLNDITSPFDGDNCPALIGKPKVFFIQACRGCGMQSKVLVTDGAGASRIQKSGKVYSIAKDSDFLIALSTVEGYVSLRDEYSGSWFIQSLCKHLKEGSKRDQDILRILTNVNNDVSREEGIIEDENNDIVDAKMTPQPQFTLRKLLIFKAPKGQAAASTQKKTG